MLQEDSCSSILSKLSNWDPTLGWLNCKEDSAEFLDACPHCESNKNLKIVESIFTDIHCYVKCSCGCIGPVASTHQLAMMKWNNRTKGNCYFCGNNDLLGYLDKNIEYCPKCRTSWKMKEW